MTSDDNAASIIAQVRRATIMKELPADAMATAIDMVCEARNTSVIVSSLPGAVIIARAIVAERERCANKAREWSAHYPQGSDGRNTFVLLAEWIEIGI